VDPLAVPGVKVNAAWTVFGTAFLLEEHMPWWVMALWSAGLLADLLFEHRVAVRAWVQRPGWFS